MNDKLKVYFQDLARRRAEDAVKFAAVREQKQRFIDDLDGSKISSTELVNCLPNGQIQTVNSMKYPTREIKHMGDKLQISLPPSHIRDNDGGTEYADTRSRVANGPCLYPCNAEIYLAVTKSGVNLLKSNINLL